jgi:mono/diheme cytochrome c family protein
MRFLAMIGSLAIVIAVAGGVYFFGGFYSVAASVEDPGVVAWALQRVRSASIDRHATERPAPLSDEAQVLRTGAKAFLARGCANCHGGPGVEWAKFSEGLNPSPADLKEVAPERSPREIFWVLKNGIRMTGMPGFGAAGVDDTELWAITAFVKKFPQVTEAQFKEWTTAAP